MNLDADIILYNGLKYYRFPNHAGKSKRRYYWVSNPQRRVGYLHRHIWEDVFGPIPKGHEIHHKDENTLNNNSLNLECLTKAEHMAHHKEEGFYEKRKIPMKCCIVCNRQYQATGFKQKFCVECKTLRKRK